MPVLKRIGAVVIAYNSEQEIGPCLDSIPREVETIVVDNASTDGTRERVRERRRVRLIANPWNRGFAAAANQGIDALDTEYALVLNPDVELDGGLETLAAACDAPQIAGGGGKLLGPDGRPQQGFMFRDFPTPLALAFEVLGINRLWRNNPVNRRYRRLDADPDIAAEVDQPAGAMLMLRQDVWRKLGGFDESFGPVWFEDVDLLRRAASAGYRARYVPTAVARHKGAHAVSRIAVASRELYWYGNLLKYAARHFPRIGRLAVAAAVMVGSLLRAILGIIRSGSVKPVLIYARVFRLAGGIMFSGSGEAPVLLLPSKTVGDGVIR
ncbi:MAG TPA: glycosyltransferase family 2 protein [Bryobacteraceae bacterium]|nr:glycosyltransferase family 2 protein [Bryobacteraceae bacterium]